MRRPTRPALRRPTWPALRRPALPALVAASAVVVLASASVTVYAHDESAALDSAMGPILTPVPPMTDWLVFGPEPAVPDVVVRTDSGQQAPAKITTPITLGPLAQRTDPDVMVTRDVPFSPKAVNNLAGLAAGGAAGTFRSGLVAVAGKIVPTAGVDPAQFRQFAAKGTAESTAVWQVVADGEAVASHVVAKQLGLVLGDILRLRPMDGGLAIPVRLGALATTGIPSAHIIVNQSVGDSLGLPPTNGVILAAGTDGDPVKLANEVRALTGEQATVDLLSQPKGNPMAYLTGSDAAQAFGAFSYRYYPDGTIAPDADWVQANIRTTTVPIVGRVTCHRLMLPQLRGALEEVVARGLSDKLHVQNGCYVPRFIGSDPDRPISLHTWGIAIDFDAATNYRGIRGTMDMRVVNIFKRWGFRWGGDWNYTDPMHFELAAIFTN